MLVLWTIFTSIGNYMHLPKLWLYLFPALLPWAQLFSRLIFPYLNKKQIYNTCYYIKYINNKCVIFWSTSISKNRKFNCNKKKKLKYLNKSFHKTSELPVICYRSEKVDGQPWWVQSHPSNFFRPETTD